MADYIDAGKLNQPVQVLELRETAPGVWEWTPVRRTWASITFQSKTNLFSKVGIGARDAAVIGRRQALTLHYALRWGDTHLFLTSIVPMGRNHLEVDAAVVRVETVRQMAERDAVVQTFPGVLTEKYVRHGQEWPMSVNELGLVLVTPKAVTLPPGGLVEARGGEWGVQGPREEGAVKNEVEVGRAGGQGGAGGGVTSLQESWITFTK